MYSNPEVEEEEEKQPNQLDSDIKNQDANFKHDSDGSNSPFTKHKGYQREHSEMNVPLNQMISDIANKRGMDKHDEMRYVIYVITSTVLPFINNL